MLSQGSLVPALSLHALYHIVARFIQLLLLVLLCLCCLDLAAVVAAAGAVRVAACERCAADAGCLAQAVVLLDDALQQNLCRQQGQRAGLGSTKHSWLQRHQKDAGPVQELHVQLSAHKGGGELMLQHAPEQLLGTTSTHAGTQAVLGHTHS